MRIFCIAKHSHIFPTKKIQCICNINILNFNETLTNNVVNFEQPAPELIHCSRLDHKDTFALLN